MGGRGPRGQWPCRAGPKQLLASHVNTASALLSKSPGDSFGCMGEETNRVRFFAGFVSFHGPHCERLVLIREYTKLAMHSYGGNRYMVLMFVGPLGKAIMAVRVNERMKEGCEYRGLTTQGCKSSVSHVAMAYPYARLQESLAVCVVIYTYPWPSLCREIWIIRIRV